MDVEIGCRGDASGEKLDRDHGRAVGPHRILVNVAAGQEPVTPLEPLVLRQRVSLKGTSTTAPWCR